MADRIIGPAGVLPPGEWAIGARIARRTAGGWSGPTVLISHHDRDLASLDLTFHALDFGTRALLAIVSPETSQPPCAPRWYRCDDWTWRLSLGFADHGTVFGDIVIENGPDVGVDGIESEPCPRRSLVMALRSLDAAAWGASIQ